jgi:hypothetical protein
MGYIAWDRNIARVNCIASDFLQPLQQSNRSVGLSIIFIARQQ